MKKLSAFLLTLILFAFCAKDIAVSPSGQEGSGGGQVCFSASMLSLTESKAADVKKQWQDGDQIAIFVDGDDSTIYAYDINSAGEMSPAEGVAAFEVKDSDLVQATYLAFYPYNANFTTLEEYQTATSTHEDIMSSIASGTSTVEFTFSHDAALLYFNFLVGDAISEATLSTAEQSYVLDFEVEGYQASCSIFVEPIDDISDVMLKIVSGTKSYYYSMAADFASWSVGCSYNYSNLNIGLSTGSGTQEDPFLIYSAENMRKVGTGTDDWSLSAHYKLMCDVDLGGIDNSGAGVAANQWAAIGTSSENFTGTFDGGGYKISGIYINNSTADNQGLFGYINGATIKNLVVAGSVTCNSGVGGVVGRALSSTITNCCNSVEILSGESAVGGVVGYASSSTIAACYNTAKINGAESVGGVVGNLRSSSTLSVSYSSSSVAGQTSWGGVVGNAYASSVASCYWNSDEFSGDGVGNITDSTVSNVVGRTTEAMHFVDFLLQLNDAAYQYNNDTETPSTLACAWIAGSDGYPTLDFSNTNPTETAYSGGDGSEAWPYKIATAEDMRELSAAVAAGTTYYNLYFEMVNDVDLGGIDENGDGIAENEFTAIGNNSNKFRGVFDGCGFMVSGLYINKSSSSNQGLFGCIGYLTGATTIKNLSVAGSVTGLYPVGGVVGYIAISSCIVTGCHNYCSINSASVALSSSTGGVVGNNGNGATITSCSNSGDITSVNYYVGGVVGYNNGGTLTYCHNSGDVIGSYSTGGVVGYAVGGTLTYCHNSGDVIGSYSTGGVVGYNEGTLTNCYNTAYIEGATSGTTSTIYDVAQSAAGGVAGHNFGTTANSYSRGSVKCKYSIGGVAGANTNIGLITNCYASGTIDPDGGVSTYVGGVAGTSSFVESSSILFANCYWDFDTLDVAGNIDSSHYLVKDSEKKTTAEMQDATFVDLLNSNADTYNNPTDGTDAPVIKACTWSADTQGINNGYPILLYDVE